MTYEKDMKGIPEYALQPAKAPTMGKSPIESASKVQGNDALPDFQKPAVLPPAAKGRIVSAEAVYHKEKFTYPQEVQHMVYQFEEDILVPDTRADMKEILLIDGTCDVSPIQKKLIPKADDLLNMTGNVMLQTLYNPEGDNTPVSVTTNVPYKYQWAIKLSDPADAVFSCRVKSVDAMIINERKFRVKIALEFSVRLYAEQEFQFFEGLRNETLEMQRKEITISSLGAVKRDEVTIEEAFRGKDAGVHPETILKQEYAIVENYRQVTTEKIVINGFVYVSLLYLGVFQDGKDGRKQKICQHNQRIEFTQFIPLEKDLRGKSWSAIRCSFSGEHLCAALGFDSEQPDEPEFRITGEIITRVELFESRRRVMAADAFHREKIFGCDKVTKRLSCISDAAGSENAVREIAAVSDGEKAAAAVFCTGRVISCLWTLEKGRITAEGEIAAGILWQSGDLRYHGEKKIIPFRSVIDMDTALPSKKAMVVPVVKSAWTELINEKQLEINISLVLSVELFDEQELILLSNPHFEDREIEKDYPMVIAAMQQGEQLWDVAKKYRTTEENIRMANRLQGEPEAGQRLLIVR